MERNTEREREKEKAREKKERGERKERLNEFPDYIKVPLDECAPSF